MQTEASGPESEDPQITDQAGVMPVGIVTQTVFAAMGLALAFTGRSASSFRPSMLPFKFSCALTLDLGRSAFL